MASRDDTLAVGPALIKTIIFGVVGVLILGVLWVQFGQIRFNDQKTYSALFTSASGIQEAATVTANGVDVGRVDAIEVTEQSLARVTFTIDGTLPLAQGSTATIKFKNLTGDQYLDLAEGAPGSPPLAEGGEIPVAQTHPALDIDVLLGGFNPLLQGLQPEQVNQLSSELVSVLQGQGGTINSVLAHAASFSGSLAEQDEVIGSVINNLNVVAGGLDQHSAELSETVLKAQQVLSKLDEDRHELTDGVVHTGAIAKHFGDLVAAARTGHDAIEELGGAVDRFIDDRDEFDRILGLLPGAYLRLGRVSTNGAGYDFGLCGVRVRATGPDGKPYYSPQIGPSDNNLQCSRNPVAPLQGQGPTHIHGPKAGPPPEWDGQARAEDFKDQGYVEKHDENPGKPEKGRN